MSKYTTITILAILFILLVLPQVANAALVPCGRHENDPATPEDETAPCNICHIFLMLQRVLNGIGLVAAGWAIIFIVIGGIVLLTSAGSPEKTSQGKKMISYALIGIIIAFGAWLVINTIMVRLVNPQVMPWPWNKIKCVPTEPIEENGEKKEEEGDFCICEVPVYDLDLSEYPDQAKQVATNVKVTKLAEEECQYFCSLPEYSEEHCPTWFQSGVKFEDYKFYCRTEDYVKSTSAVSRKYPAYTPTSTCTMGCFATKEECDNSVNPGDANFEKCGRNCFWMGVNWCDQSWGGGSGICVHDPGTCPSSRPYRLVRFKEESACRGSTLWDCWSTDECYCRLGNERYGSECVSCTAETDPCKQMNPPLGQTVSCLGGNYTCQQGVVDQYSDACDELKKFLTCMAGKNLSAAAREISSISDNSPNPQGGLPGCFNEWKSTCPAGTDSCTGTCCGHGKDFLHYGGKLSKKDMIGCRECSWAVDFADENSKDELEKAAKECGEEIPILKKFGKGANGIDVVPEGDHVHIELDGIARYYYKCM